MSGIGILGEDRTDCDTVAILIRRIINAPQGQGVRVRGCAPPSGGCSALRRKAENYLRDLLRRGFRSVVLVHDLDRSNGQLNDLSKLKEQLEKIAVPGNMHRLICVPVEEIEAWFWSDQAVLDRVARDCCKAANSPHSIIAPKEELIRASAKAHGGKSIYSTNENPKLAELLDLDLCAKRCESFRELRHFVERHLAFNIDGRAG